MKGLYIIYSQKEVCMKSPYFPRTGNMINHVQPMEEAVGKYLHTEYDSVLKFWTASCGEWKSSGKSELKAVKSLLELYNECQRSE